MYNFVELGWVIDDIIMINLIMIFIDQIVYDYYYVYIFYWLNMYFI
jgi:hypothetical protein